jgi:hypothetical protein
MLASAALWANSAADNPDYDATARRVAALVQQVKPAVPLAWTRIPWVPSLAEARDISRRENRPVFLFALMGNLATGRC